MSDWFYITLYAAYLGVLLAIAWQDLNTLRIPHRWNHILLAVTLGILLLDLIRGRAGEPVYWGRILMGFLLTLFLLLGACRLLDGRGLGGGDVRMACIGSLLLGPEGVMQALSLAALLAIPWGLRLRRKGRRLFPFGPFLAAGIWAALVRQRMI